MKKAIIIVLVVIAAIATALGIFSYQMLKKYQAYSGFLEKTTLNGESIEGLTPEEVVSELSAEYNTDNTRVLLLENGKTALSGTLKEYGYSYDEDSLLSFLKEAREDQRNSIFTLLSSLYRGYDLSADEIYTLDEKTLADFVKADHLAEKRVETVDHSVVLDEAANRYKIAEGSIGNMLDEKKLQALVTETLDEAVDNGSLPKEITIEIPAEFYTSKEPAGDLTAMQAECDERNLIIEKQELLNSFQDFSLTYTFGNVTEILDYSAVKDWISVEDDLSVWIDQDALQSFVTQLGLKYDTLYEKREFKTSTGKTITFSAGENEYGFRIDFDAECEQLNADILAKEPVVRDPVYVATNEFGNPYYFARNGEDDLAGTYVEVNLTKQHLWYYVNGNLLVESDIVSGSVADKKETQTGVFALPFMESPSVLTGEEAAGSGSYSTEVQYWMPFYEGQGLHDASWRSSFGGNIYKTSGSHGCVNLPPDVAKTIYENITLGTAIIIYKE